MKIQTSQFGEIQIEEKDIIYFEEGLPGFQAEKKFVLLKDEQEEESPFQWLQSVDNGAVALVLLDVMSIYGDYVPEIVEEDLKGLGAYGENDLIVLNIAVVPENYKEMTVNLLAPILINLNTKKGRQIIVNNQDYSVRHFLFQEIESKGADQ